MTALEIAIGATAHVLLGITVLAFFSAPMPSGLRTRGVVLVVGCIVGASYFWARVAGFA